MPANFTRRRDLFIDAGFESPDDIMVSLKAYAKEFGLITESGDGAKPALDDVIARAEKLAEDNLSVRTKGLLEQSIEWLFERGGDLTTFLWMARQLEDGDDNVNFSILSFGLAAKLWRYGLQKEAAALLRFLVEVDFDYGALYKDSGIAYGFFQSREPNPLVWKLLDYVDERAHNVVNDGLEQLSILELGCGIGNDALGLLSSDRTTKYAGVDISPLALKEHKKRVGPRLNGRSNIEHIMVEDDFVSALRTLAKREQSDTNLIYSYSSLHYFSSDEVSEIFSLVRKVLHPKDGLFAFAIKGKGSIWDGQGVPLYKPDVWINYDGQSRWFPSRKSLGKLIDRHGFEMRLHEWHEHWGYSEYGKLDLFHYVICSPRG